MTVLTDLLIIASVTVTVFAGVRYIGAIWIRGAEINEHTE